MATQVRLASIATVLAITDEQQCTCELAPPENGNRYEGTLACQPQHVHSMRELLQPFGPTAPTTEPDYKGDLTIRFELQADGPRKAARLLWDAIPQQYELDCVQYVYQTGRADDEEEPFVVMEGSDKPLRVTVICAPTSTKRLVRQLRTRPDLGIRKISAYPANILPGILEITFKEPAGPARIAQYLGIAEIYAQLD